MYCLCFVFFKQKTADDMRISDWSSDVCSSDLGIVWASSTTPTGFVPNEDRGIIFTNVELPAGASLDRTVEVTRELCNKLEQIPGVTGGTLVNGYSLISGAGRNYALGFIKLAPWSERKADSLSADALLARKIGRASGRERG